MDLETVTVGQGFLIMLAGVTLFGAGGYYAGWMR
jgi:hypothetical protein